MTGTEPVLERLKLEAETTQALAGSSSEAGGASAVFCFDEEALLCWPC